ncbi:MAG: cyclopropane-fatty-acyl-phospholipid synthase [Planctomycetota bacterium]|jgi:cyclopropane-fatty-acyl-phospholipid synthase|nr:cyclopropane-fatty-acyl-phospholipid synthase [Planctomycetota bacterium]
MSIGIGLAERGVLPDLLIRRGIRSLLKQRIGELARDDESALLAELRTSPVAVHQDAANQQHYEVPSEFYQLALGPHLKYSGCYWDETCGNLGAAEDRTLALYVERAGIEDGMDILDVGCGWGSFSLYLAQRFPQARIRGISNSATQRAFIEQQCQARGLSNLTIDTADLASYAPPGRYDRLVSVECLEHMRNHGELFRRFRTWLRDEGRAFIHVFVHHRQTYLFETEGDDNWMGRHFFTGGMMPGFKLFHSYDDALVVERDWAVNGSHYGRTARAWLHNTDLHREEITRLFNRDLDAAEARKQVNRWRLFFMACEELFNYDRGREWQVGHYLLKPRGTP